MTLKMVETLEAQRAIAQSSLDVSKTAAQRNALGQFSTPLPLAQAIVEQVRELWPKDQDNIRFLDPALGTGVFFLGGTLGNPNLSETIPQTQLSNVDKWTSLPGNPLQ